MQGWRKPQKWIRTERNEPNLIANEKNSHTEGEEWRTNPSNFCTWSFDLHSLSLRQKVVYILFT